MPSYIWCYPVFLFAVSAHKLTTDAGKVADVIKNISRVNDVLQELIHNYEQLQRIYKSQETLDDSNDKAIKNISTGKKNYLRFDGVPTKMIFSESADNSSPEGTAKWDSDNSPEVLRQKNTAENTEPRQIDSNVTTLKLNFSLENAKPSIIFIDTHKKEINNRESLEKDISKDGQDTTKKTRFSVQASEGGKHKKNKTKKHKDVQDHSTTKLPNNIVVIDNNKQIGRELKDHASTATTRTGREKKARKMKYILRHREDRRWSNQTTFAEEVFDEVDPNGSSAASADRIDDLSKFISRTSILRKEYGDACLKLVVRKCYKACKAVLKSVCKGNCKDRFEDAYDGFSRTGCIKSFVPPDAVKVKRKEVRDSSKETNKIHKLKSKTKSKDKSSKEKSKEKSKDKSSKEKSKEKMKEKSKEKSTEKSSDEKSKEKLKEKTKDKAKDKSSEEKSKEKTKEKTKNKLFEEKSKAKLKRTSEKALKEKKHGLRYKGIEIDINDSTHGYLTAVCNPAPKIPLVPLRIAPGTNITAFERSLHVLRAKYEKACIKTSREKCSDACTYAYTNACKKHKCKSKREKAFGKECKRHCKIAYKSDSNKSESSSSSSSSSSSD